MRSAEIVKMPGVLAPDRPIEEQPSADVIDMCERLLAQARHGDLRALAIAGVRPGGITTYEFAGANLTGHFLGAAIGDLFFEFFGMRSMERSEYVAPPDEIA